MSEDKVSKIEPLHPNNFVQFGASVDSEVDSIVFVLEQLRLKGKAPVSYKLPEGLPDEFSEELGRDENIGRKNLTTWLSGKFNQEIYQPALSIIKANWQPIETEYFQLLQTINGLITPSKIIGDVVLFGVGGGYYPDKNKFSIWTDGNQLHPKFKRTNPIHTVGHEIIELSLHPIIKSLDVPRWDKERIVDLFMTQTPLENLFPGYKEQDQGNRSIDSMFSWQKAQSNLVGMIQEIKGK